VLLAHRSLHRILDWSCYKAKSKDPKSGFFSVDRSILQQRIQCFPALRRRCLTRGVANKGKVKDTSGGEANGIHVVVALPFIHNSYGNWTVP
jgi:hypothetical protein